MRGWTVAIVLFLAMGVLLADSSRDLRVAARAGNLTEVRRLAEAGVSIDATDDWGMTALALAAKQGEADVVAFLLEKGADPSAREEFFGQTVLASALNREAAPEFTIARMVLAAGAKDRARAVLTALRANNPDLAQAAVDAGPVTESELERLRQDFPEWPDAFKTVLKDLKVVADPAPPTYTAKQLRAFAGEFAGRDLQATLKVVDGRLTLTQGGETVALAPHSGDRRFRDADGKVTVRYFGRANSVEGMSIQREGAEEMRLRPADAPVVAVDLPEYVEPDASARTVHWPGFRGANRAGVGDGVDTPVDFDLGTGQGVAWSVDLPGLGNSSPVVWGDRVYVTTAVAKGGSTPLRVGLTGAGDEVEENVEHRWLVLAYDKKTGKQVWETEVGKAVPLTKRHFKATQANSSPVTDGRHVVVVFPTAGLACLGTDGKVHWKHELGGLNAGGFNDPGMEWGFAASPIIHDGRVILQVDIHEGPYLAAWDLKTGKPLWKTAREGVAPSWSTPAIWPTPDGDQLVVNASNIRGYDPATGEELWRLGPTSIQVVASPVVGAKNVIVSSGYPPARPIYSVQPGIRGEHTIESPGDAAPLAWHQSRGGAYMPTPLLYRGLLYMVAHNGRMVAHDARTGAKVLQARFSQGGTCTSSPVAANGKIYQGTEEGTLYVLAAGPEHRELAVHDFGEPLMATPAISEGRLIVRTPSKLIALQREP